ncbi:adenylate/guanylate cyclase domain-containing protein [Haliangium sp.]|uniref:adenylate/guanylate cyclase domain-containing protein n=1 Tax=Haliangium sp. TaxID=2663208 RepID=UPI003D0D4C55
MGIPGFVKRRMAVKVFLAIGLLVGTLLALQAWTDVRREVATLRAQSEGAATDIARLFIGAVEHSMLQGEGLQVKALVAELKDRLSKAHAENQLPDAQVHIYDQRGIEVFAPDPPAPSRDEIPPDVLRVLDEDRRHLGDGGRVFRPVDNEDRCHACHKADSALRGVISLAFDQDRCNQTRREVLARVVSDGFTHIMTAERSQFLDTYFLELEQDSPGVERVAVFDADADVFFGRAIDDLDVGAVTALLAEGGEPRYQPRAGGGDLALVPLPMQDRCIRCHDDEIGAVRGVLAVALAPATGADSTCSSGELESVIDTSLRYIMLSRLGRRIADFLDAVATTDAVRELVLYDNLGRRYWTTTHPVPPPHVAKVVAQGQPLIEVTGAGEDERVRAVAPLVNRRECRRCHGAGSELRGVVSVSLSTAVAARMAQDTLERRAWFTALTLLAILFILAGLLHYLVVRPVHRIGDVADEVGRGNLAVVVDHADQNGDEIARLGQRINEMVHDLRAKTHLEKFVSRGAAAAAAGAGMTAIARSGERRAATVLFSDIRGFTAYAEIVAPETVVEMLNRMLQAQADVVGNFGGDIDKFVGDELMAVFQGPNAEARAVLCATRMIDAVHRVRKHGDPLSVGIGVSTGDVIYGAIGHETRMDFTVIGDVVNIGARLCAGATADEILVSDAVRIAVGPVEDLAFEAAPPMKLKGKREPQVVYRVHRVAGADPASEHAHTH